MRLWHYELIPVLPNKMLISQWRECIAIKRQWEKGTLKHRLVSYVMDYDKYYFRNYILDIVKAMEDRKINYQTKYKQELLEFCEDTELSFENIMACYPKHNNRYLKQCFYNLQEKYDRGIITEVEWDKIVDYCYSNDRIKEIVL